MSDLVGKKLKYFHPLDQEYVPTLPFVADIENGETKIEADGPYALVCGIIGLEYYDAEGEDTCWFMRADYAAKTAAFFTAMGTPVLVTDSTLPPDKPVWAPEGQDPVHIIYVDSDWTLVASLHNLGDITLYERADVRAFSEERPLPKCGECAYFDAEEDRCLLFNTWHISDLKPSCADGIDREGIPLIEAPPGMEYRRLGKIVIPEFRLKRFHQRKS
ncbi:MAG: hypothetical protein ACPLSY_03460 [Moorellaceae bacterium]